MNNMIVFCLCLTVHQKKESHDHVVANPSLHYTTGTVNYIVAMHGMSIHPRCKN